jgi:hypothetical protein
MKVIFLINVCLNVLLTVNYMRNLVCNILTKNLISPYFSVQTNLIAGFWNFDVTVNCVKSGTSSLNSQRVNKLGYPLATETN